ncbi:glycoside hydrolase family 26 protein [Spongiimicrobium sp. 3-5]|uniref:glycoside hydrolase family 26 protein n=1 Tax=Spongiimicrobium sp. 3-5 TaxID=3332596 RepID=UPI00397ED21D
MKSRIYLLILITISLQACRNSEKNVQPQEEIGLPAKKLAKFEPHDGEVILFVGQELDAIGGTEHDQNGYFDHFDAPGGFTMYTDIMPGLTETFLDHSFTYSGLNGIWETDDWGDGPNNISLQLADADFENSVLAIGLAIIDNEEKIASGEHDVYIKKLGNFFHELGKRPVFLRIGFEFAGPWNRYDRESYILAYRRIKDLLDEQGVSNVAYVWQSKGFGNTIADLEAWYPGDDYVDWCGYSFFSNYKQAKMVKFAQSKEKPVFIAEATPTSIDWENDPEGNTGLTKEFLLSNPEQAQMAWEEWFVPFFNTIDTHPETIKAISYINGNWRAKPRWKVNPTFKNIDARLQLSKEISERWKEETGKAKYLKASPDLFARLYNN